MNGRWAMLGVAGILGAEALGVPTKWYEAGAASYDIPILPQLGILFPTLGFFETKRYIGFKQTGTVSCSGENHGREVSPVHFKLSVGALCKCRILLRRQKASACCTVHHIFQA